MWCRNQKLRKAKPPSCIFKIVWMTFGVKCFNFKAMRKVFSTAAILSVFIIMFSAATASAATASDVDARKLRAQVLENSFGTYCLPPRLTNGRVDIAKLVEQLSDLHANTYSFCLHMAPTDWPDLKLFLPLAAKKGIRVWASIVPPSESPPRTKKFAEPFRMNYDRWAQELAKLSLRETNLVAWSIDDFTLNQKWFPPAGLAAMLAKAREINPRLAFVPCCYYKTITPQFVTNYVPLIDGILFPYRHESAGANLTNAMLAGPELQKLKTMTGADFPVLIDVYASPHSKLGKSTPEYVKQVMVAGKKYADGVMIYCHQDPQKNPEKYQIIKRLFTAWTVEKPSQ
jgi:hypothetical protein